jgi:hypothetical protein
MGGEQMDSDDDVRVVFADVGQGPPMSIDARGIIERGGRIRRRRKRLAVLGTSVTTAAAIVAIALASGQRPPEPAPVEPAGPGISLETAPPSAPSQLPPGEAVPPQTTSTTRLPPPRAVTSAPTAASRTQRPTTTEPSPARPPSSLPLSVVGCTVCPN